MTITGTGNFSAVPVPTPINIADGAVARAVHLRTVLKFQAAGRATFPTLPLVATAAGAAATVAGPLQLRRT